jgi:hypothetical protein
LPCSRAILGISITSIGIESSRGLKIKRGYQQAHFVVNSC